MFYFLLLDENIRKKSDIFSAAHVLNSTNTIVVK